MYYYPEKEWASRELSNVSHGQLHLLKLGSCCSLISASESLLLIRESKSCCRQAAPEHQEDPQKGRQEGHGHHRSAGGNAGAGHADAHDQVSKCTPYRCCQLELAVMCHVSSPQRSSDCHVHSAPQTDLTPLTSTAALPPWWTETVSASRQASSLEPPAAGRQDHIRISLL